MKFFYFFVFLSLSIHFALSLICYRCQTGYVTSEVCSNQLPGGFQEECDGPGSQCYDSVQWFNDGALRLVVRGCWTPGANSTSGGFCDNYDNPEGLLKLCRNCTEDLCNTEVLYFPIPLLECYV